LGTYECQLSNKINKKEADLMQAFAQKMGYGLAPDPYYHHVKADVDGTLVLFLPVKVDASHLLLNLSQL
jgi:hypothetical protein